VSNILENVVGYCYVEYEMLWPDLSEWSRHIKGVAG